jgi:predicted nuclease with TOPRIM domain
MKPEHVEVLVEQISQDNQNLRIKVLVLEERVNRLEDTYYNLVNRLMEINNGSHNN